MSIGNSEIKLWNLDDRKLENKLSYNVVSNIVNDKILAYECKSGKVKVWDVRENKTIFEFKNYELLIENIIICENKKTLVLNGLFTKDYDLEDPTYKIKIYDIEEKKQIFEAITKFDKIETILASKNGSIIAISGREYFDLDEEEFYLVNSIRIYNINLNKVKQINMFSQKDLENNMSQIFTDSENNILISLDWPDLPSKEYLDSDETLMAKIHRMKSENIQKNCTLYEAKFWDLISCKFLYNLKLKNQLFDMSATGIFIHLSDNNDEIVVRKLKTGHLLHSISNKLTKLLAISSDGETIASVDNDNILRLWNLKTFSLVYRKSDLESPIRELKFSKDSKKIIATFSNKTVGIWEEYKSNNDDYSHKFFDFKFQEI